jgi:hypothetical protein
MLNVLNKLYKQNPVQISNLYSHHQYFRKFTYIQETLKLKCLLEYIIMKQQTRLPWAELDVEVTFT